jgi:hypothetical protein
VFYGYGQAPQGRHAIEQPRLPRFEYYLDESDPDIVALRRQDGTFVAAFSARGATREGILEAAQEDYRALLERYEERSDDQAGGQQRGA